MDERRWGVDVAREYENYRASRRASGDVVITLSEFVSIASLYWEADALNRKRNEILDVIDDYFMAAQILMALYGVGVVGINLYQGFQYSLIKPKITVDLGGIWKYADGFGYHFQLPSVAVEGSFAVVGAITSIDQLTAQQIEQLTMAVHTAISNAGGGGTPPERPGIPEMADRGSTGRTIPNNLNEQLAMQEVISNPLSGATHVNIEMRDPRWPASEGWVKKQRRLVLSDGTAINIHFAYNNKLNLVDDFKFVY